MAYLIRQPDGTMLETNVSPGPLASPLDVMDSSAARMQRNAEIGLQSPLDMQTVGDRETGEDLREKFLDPEGYARKKKRRMEEAKMNIQSAAIQDSYVNGIAGR